MNSNINVYGYEYIKGTSLEEPIMLEETMNI